MNTFEDITPDTFEENITRMSRANQYGGESNQVLLIICEDQQREAIFKAFTNNNPTVKTAMIESGEVNTDYQEFNLDPETVIFVDCKTDFIRRFYIIKSIPKTTIFFFLNPREQRQEMFDRGELQRYTSFHFPGGV